MPITGTGQYLVVIQPVFRRRWGKNFSTGLAGEASLVDLTP